MAEPHLWAVGISDVEFEDGNYPTFRPGAVVEFAVEAWVDEDRELVALEPAADLVPSRALTHRWPWHEIPGRSMFTWTGVIEFERTVSVLDIGLSAYLEDYAFSPGTWVQGEVHLAVDTYMYIEDYAGLPGISPLVHTWEIERIQTCENGELIDLDVAPISWTPGQQVSRSYLLTVRLLDAPPRFSSRTAFSSRWASKDTWRTDSLSSAHVMG